VVAADRLAIVTVLLIGASNQVMMKQHDIGFAEDLLVRGLKRSYLGEMRGSDGPPRYGELGAAAVARLSFAGVHRLRDMLWAEREVLRDLEDHRAADSLTSALRDLDSRMQILDDLLR
jgi:hypothetical protein